MIGWIESGIPGLHQAPGVHSIRIEQQVTESTYVLRAELPGIDPADVEISVTGDVLTLRTERTERTETEARSDHSEFRYGAFARAVRLPVGARGDEATADYKDGVLTITIPLPETKTGTTTIPVRHG
ncbi:molecular chaperone Hsp20 [Streptomyces varsoviensis]|uniref:Molecular chaperone Hsp20 n=1 Tax=Streptomyces varsoviensis TaxID=67373 RepID=A0ABR5IYG5_9ACTN|nr:molecular chaperone Hsp20 [Streptomyces varsoviensis]